MATRQQRLRRTPISADGGYHGRLFPREGGVKEAKARRGSTPLRLAIMGCHPSVNTLLYAGAEVSAPQMVQDNIHVAVELGDAAIVASLAVKGANLNPTDHLGRTPLYRAVEEGNEEIVRVLLRRGVDTESHGIENFTALHHASLMGDNDILLALLKHGADTEALAGGRTALSVAAIHRETRAVQLLLDARANIDHAREVDGTTALGVAAGNSDTATLGLLSERDASLEIPNAGGCSPLHFVCTTRRPGAENAVDLLLRAGADETLRCSEGYTATALLDFGSGDCSDYHADNDKVERVRQLLGQAPVDRKWRRRCDLILLRSRQAKAKEQIIVDVTTEADNGRAPKVARGRAKDAASSEGRGGGGAGNEGWDLKDFVTKLLDLDRCILSLDTSI
eukprot:g19171.t1